MTGRTQILPLHEGQVGPYVVIAAILHKGNLVSHFFEEETGAPTAITWFRPAWHKWVM